MSANTKDQPTIPEPAKVLTRDELRTAILGDKPQVHPVTYKGMALELVEPSLGEILDFQQMEDQKQGALMMLVRYVHVPGTGERVFEEADMAAMTNMPFSPDLQNIMNKITSMMEVGVTDADKSKAPAESTDVDDNDGSAGAA